MLSKHLMIEDVGTHAAFINAKSRIPFRIIKSTAHRKFNNYK